MVDLSSLSSLFPFHSASLWLWVFFFFFFLAIWADLILVSNCSGCGLIAVVVVVIFLIVVGFFFFFNKVVLVDVGFCW